MAQVKLDIKELVDLIRGEGFSTADAKRNIMHAFLEMFHSREFDAALQAHAEKVTIDISKPMIQAALKEAIRLEITSPYSSNRKTVVTGWAAGMLQQEIRKAFEGEDLKSVVTQMVQQELHAQRALFSRTLEDTKPFIADQVRILVTGIVTEAYTERVAQQLDKVKVEALVLSLVQKTMGAMLMDGTLQMGAVPKTAE